MTLEERFEDRCEIHAGFVLIRTLRRQMQKRLSRGGLGAHRSLQAGGGATPRGRRWVIFCILNSSGLGPGETARTRL